MSTEEEIKINIENEPPNSPTNTQNTPQDIPVSNETDNIQSVPVNSDETSNKKDEIMNIINGYLHSADQVIDEAGKYTLKYGNPIVEFTSKMANKFKEYFNLK